MFSSYWFSFLSVYFYISNLNGCLVYLSMLVGWFFCNKFKIPIHSSELVTVDSHCLIITQRAHSLFIYILNHQLIRKKIACKPACKSLSRLWFSALYIGCSHPLRKGTLFSTFSIKGGRGSTQFHKFWGTFVFGLISHVKITSWVSKTGCGGRRRGGQGQLWNML